GRQAPSPSSPTGERRADRPRDRPTTAATWPARRDRTSPRRVRGRCRRGTRMRGTPTGPRPVPATGPIDSSAGGRAATQTRHGERLRGVGRGGGGPGGGGCLATSDG